MKFTKVKSESPEIRKTRLDGMTRATLEQLIEMQQKAKETGWTEEHLKKYFNGLGVHDLENITWFQWNHLMSLMERFPK